MLSAHPMGAPKHEPHPPLMTKAYLVAACAALLGPASAATIINFGLTTGATPAAGVTFNNVATSTAAGQTINVPNLNDQANAPTGISLTSSAGMFAMGAGGSFSPVGTPTYTTGGSSVVDGWVATYQPAYGNLWQGGSNSSPSTGQAITLTFGGLAANTTYEITLLSARANTFAGFGDPGTYGLSYEGAATGVTTALLGTGTLDSATVTGGSAGSASGLNAREITWTFTTDADPGNAEIQLGGDWNVNAIVIVPEPSAAILGGVGLLVLLRRRRA